MLVPAAAIALSVTVIFLVALRPVATSIGLVDKPGGRKRHVGTVPVIGGVAVFVGLAAGLLLLGSSVGVSLYLLSAGGLLVAIGVLDDKYALPAAVRLAAQLSAVLVMYFGVGLQMNNAGDPFGMGVINLGPLSLLFTVLVAMSVINAFNLVDGMDGLAGTMGILALVPVAIIAGYGSPAGMLSIVVIAAVFGFLVFNFPAANNRSIRTFLGDAGSTFLGFLVVYVTMGVSYGEAAVVSPVVCLWFAAMPIYDLFTCFVRRIFHGHSPFKPGRDHFHHMLSRSGMGVRRTLAILATMQVLFSSVGLVAYFSNTPDVVVFAVWAFAGLTQWWLVRKVAAVYRLDQRNERAREIASTN